jgi:HD-GYP domain-containing protein (c-di-GMP phosphodiesterase class II)
VEKMLNGISVSYDKTTDMMGATIPVAQVRKLAETGYAQLKKRSLVNSLAKETQRVKQEIESKHRVNLDGLDLLLSDAIQSGELPAHTLLKLNELKKYHQESYFHSVEVGILTTKLAKGFGYDDATAVEFGIAGLVHDVGKGMIPIEVLDKPGEFTAEEKGLMDMHALYSAILLEGQAAFTPRQIRMVADHHDYSTKAQDTQMLQAADVYSALTTDRCYRKGFSPVEAINLMRQPTRCGNSLNKDIVDELASYGGWN